MRVLRVAKVRVAAVRIVKAIFPLNDHAEMLVVDDHRLGRDAFDVGCGQFLDVHQERAVAIDIDDLFVGKCDLRAERGGIAVPHRAEAR